MSSQYEFVWSPPPLSPEDQRLIDAYTRLGRAVDDLAYTPEFEELCRGVIDGEVNDTKRHHIFKRLLGLRKTGRLPRVGAVGSR